MSAGPRPLVLVVEDDADIRCTIGLCLEAENFRVALANDGLGALEAISLQRPDVMLLDLWMPRMNGLQLMEELPRRGEGSLPVVLLSADRDVAAHAATMAAAGFVSKPFRTRELLGKIREALGSKKAG